MRSRPTLCVGGLSIAVQALQPQPPCDAAERGVIGAGAAPCRLLSCESHPFPFIPGRAQSQNPLPETSPSPSARPPVRISGHSRRRGPRGACRNLPAPHSRGPEVSRKGCRPRKAPRCDLPQRRGHGEGSGSQVIPSACFFPSKRQTSLLLGAEESRERAQKEAGRGRRRVGWMGR